MGFYPNEGDVDSNGAEEVNLRTSAGAELLGQQASAASLPVVIASNQSTLPISAASLPLPAGAATAANQATEIASLASIDAGTPAALGQTTMAASMPVTVASNQTNIPTIFQGPTTAFVRISTNGTTVVKSGAGILRRIIKMSGGNLTLYNNTAASGTVIQVISGTNPTGTLVYDIPFTIGLTIVSASGPDAVIVYE